MLSKDDPRSERGYAMLIVSIVLIVMFSMISAYLVLADVTKKRTNAFVDGNSTFYVAESGLNSRVQELRQKFLDYEIPKGTVPGGVTTATPQTMGNCFSVIIPTGATKSVQNSTNDFECRNYSFKNNNNIATVVSGGNIVLGEANNSMNAIKYVAYTFVSPDKDYTTTAPPAMVLGAGQPYAGLSAQEYKYTVHATAKRPLTTQSANFTAEEISAKSREATGTQEPSDPPLIASYNGKQGQAASSEANNSSVNTMLQMSFKNYAIPLFQFAAFYNRDLEVNSTSSMTINGWVHTNGNLYVQPTPINFTDPGIDFLGKVTTAGDIYNRVDSSTIQRTGTARVQTSGSPATYFTMPAYSSGRITPFDSATELNSSASKVVNGVGGAALLNPPEATFLRKRNYLTNNIGEYFSKADLRLEMVPDRLVPFNFTAIKSGTGATGGTCTTVIPTAGLDPAANYIDPDRQGTNFKCNELNKGQLLSMSQPVIVLTRGNTEEEARFCEVKAGVIDRTRDLINYANVTPDPLTAELSAEKQDVVLRALQTAIVGHNIPLDYGTVIRNGNLPSEVRTRFGQLLAVSGTGLNLNAKKIAELKDRSPLSIAKARRSCFLPAPIQQVVRNSGGTISDGVFDRRENRLIKALQTNIESLTVWNRDGRYVTIENDLNTNTASSLQNARTSMLDNSIYSTSDLLFTKAVASGTSVGSFDKLGMGAADLTEGGLVFHAIVSDDLNGNGSISGSTDAIGDSTQAMFKQNADGTNILDTTGNPIPIDYYRKYKGGTIKQSPYGFAFSGGNNLPAPLTIVTDQAAYLQGDYNNYPDARKGSSLLADTIMSLSVNCLSPGTNADPNNILTGQVNCAIPTTLNWNATRPWTGGNLNQGAGNMYSAATTTVNTAFLSFTTKSTGNLGVGRGYNNGAGPKVFSGGLNNYMRMVEDWGGQWFNYSGSFISLGYPIEFSGDYVSGGTPTSYYNIPNRNFAYDTNFNSFDKLPPMTPKVIYLQQEVFKRSY